MPKCSIFGSMVGGLSSGGALPLILSGVPLAKPVVETPYYVG
jgi:hypothetical protein